MRKCIYDIYVLLIATFFTISGSGIIFDNDVSLINSDIIIVEDRGYGGSDLGYPVSFLHDYNGDKLSDILTASTDILSSEKNIYITYGSKNLSNRINVIYANITFTGLKNPENIGDINGDGYTDIIAYNNSKYCIFFGKDIPSGTRMNSSNMDASILHNAHEEFLYYCSGIGDINGDDFDDFAMCQLFWPFDGTYKGKCLIFFGKKTGWIKNADMENSSDASFIGDNKDNSGFFNRAGDVNSDGFDDLLISSYRANNGKGKVNLIFGKRDGWEKNVNLSENGIIFSGSNVNEWAGVMISDIGDINGDGFDDFTIGLKVEKIYVIFGKNSGWEDKPLFESDVIINGDFSYLSRCVFAGNINKDGIDDFVISAPNYLINGKINGKVYVIFGKKEGWNEINNIESICDASFYGQENDNAGVSLDAGEDVNLDGYLDIIIGTGGDGRAYIVSYTPYQNRPPRIIGKDRIFINEDSTYKNNYTFIDEDPTTDEIFPHILTNAGWLVIDNESSTLSGIPRNEDVGSYWVNVSVNDDRGGYNWSNFTLTVNNTNDPPEIVTDNIPGAIEDVPYVKKLEARDIDPTDDMLDWSMITNANWLSLDEGSLTLTGTPDNEDIGTWSVNLTLSDGNGGTDRLNLSLNVSNVNDDPIITTVPVAFAVEDREYSQNFEFIDLDPTNDDLTASLRTNGLFLSYNGASHTVSGTPSNEEVGLYWIEFKVEDDKGGKGVLNYTLTVLNENDGPRISTSDHRTAYEDKVYLVQYAAVDPDPTGDDLIWSMWTNSSFLSIDRTNGLLKGTPTNDDVGFWKVNVSVSDGNLSDYHEFVLEVINENDPPAMVDPSLSFTMKEDTSLEIDLQGRFTDLDKDDLTYSAGTTADVTTNMDGTKITLIPIKDWSGLAMIPIYCNDGTIMVEGSIRITVENTNDRPYDLKVNYAAEYEEGSPQIVNASALDPDLDYGDSLNYTWKTKGELIGYGEKIDLGLPPGHHLINLTVTDGSGGTVSEEFTVVITGLPDGADSPLMIVALAAVMVIIVTVLVYFFVVKGKEKKTSFPSWPEPIPVIEGRSVSAPVDPETVEVGNED